MGCLRFEPQSMYILCKQNKWGVRGSNHSLCIFYAMSLPTELSLHRHFEIFFNKINKHILLIY